MKFGVAGKDAEAAFCFDDAMHHLVGADIFADAFKKAASDPAVAFRPGERAFLFGFAGGERVDAGPGGGVFGERAVVVAAGVVHVPVNKRRVEILLVKPIGEGHFVERGGFL